MTDTMDEALSQPDVWTAAVGRVAEFTGSLAAPGERVLAIGCGTSAFVAQSFASLRESAGLGETDAAFASEMLRARRYDRVIAISRSGTTTEILDALRGLPDGTRRVVITAVAGQPAEKMADEVVLLDFADERSVVQTRFPTTVLSLARAAIGRYSEAVIADARSALTATLPVDPTEFDHFVFLGTGWTIGLANEAALKLREMAQVWSESYPAMDFRHGPVAVAGKRSLVWCFGAMPAGVTETATAAGATVYEDAAVDPLAQLVLLHRLALTLTQRRGLDPDRPRLLTRSVVLTGTETLSA